MNLNLNDPDSIVAWWCEFPERHWDYLDVFAKQPQFMAAVWQARQRIRSDPRLSPLLEQAVAAGAARRQAFEVRHAADQQGRDELESPEDAWGDQLAAAPMHYGAH